MLSTTKNNEKFYLRKVCPARYTDADGWKTSENLFKICFSSGITCAGSG